MVYECCCADISCEEWEQKMQGIKPVNYRWFVNKIKKHLPWLYNDLALNLYNPRSDSIISLFLRLPNILSENKM